MRRTVARTIDPGRYAPTREATHLPRRLFHMAAASLFPVLALVLARDMLLTLLLGTATLMVGAEALRVAFPRFNALFRQAFRGLMRAEEERHVTGATYVLLGTLACFALFPRDLAILAVLFVALGDPAAALVGRRFPRGRVFGKSPWGSLAMVATGLAVGGLLHAAGAVEFHWIMAVGAVVATAAELLPLPLDDNLRVPLLAGGAMTLLAV
ncbi:MAG: hypothetical protein HY535_00710 [Chloroflexi bacterium]|nr:hypothetical protein [Chloroflexota bacterium]